LQIRKSLEIRIKTKELLMKQLLFIWIIVLLFSCNEQDVSLIYFQYNHCICIKDNVDSIQRLASFFQISTNVYKIKFNAFMNFGSCDVAPVMKYKKDTIYLDFNILDGRVITADCFSSFTYTVKGISHKTILCFHGKKVDSTLKFINYNKIAPAEVDSLNSHH
jgi:hypothetical protein